jgi:hypothetical protein
MLQVRLNAFETNSSSVHAFHIKEGFKPKCFKMPRTFNAELGTFCRDFRYFSNHRFLDYCWTAIVDVEGHIVDVEECSVRTGVVKLSPRGQELQKRIEDILQPYNVFIRWSEPDDNDQFSVEHSDKALRIIEELLNQPELFLSMVLCENSYFSTGNDETVEDHPDWAKKAGYAFFRTHN